MKGSVLGYDAQSQSGHIRGEDERRYRFTAGDVRTDRPLKAGDQVDFESEGDAANDIYLVPGAGASFDSAALRETAAKFTSAAGSAANRLNTYVANTSADEIKADLNRSPIARLLLGRAEIFYAILVLLACFAPLMPKTQILQFTPGFFISSYDWVDLEPHSLYGVAAFVGEWHEKAADVDNSSISDDASTHAAGTELLATMLKIVLFGFYIIPLCAAVMIYREIADAGTRQVRRQLWLYTSIVTIALPILATIALHTLTSGYQNLSDVNMVSDSDRILLMLVPSPVSDSVIGGWLLLPIAGVLMLLAWFGVLRAPLATASSAQPDPAAPAQQPGTGDGQS